MQSLLKFRRFLTTTRNTVGKNKYERIVCVETEIYSPLINNEIYYRGYPVHELASTRKFLDTFYLLLNEDLPSNNQIKEFFSKIVSGIDNIPSIMKDLNRILPQKLNVCDFFSSSFTLMNLYPNTESDLDYPHVFGQCLGMFKLRYLDDFKFDYYNEDPFLHISSFFLFNRGLDNIDNSVVKLMNSVFTLYMDHGLTSASYNCRLCISEGGSTFSGLTCATSTHRYSLDLMDSYLLFKKLDRDELSNLFNFFKSDNLRSPLRELTSLRRDPRCTILSEICNKHFGEDIFSNLSSIEENLSNRIFFKFDVYVYEMFKRLYYSFNNNVNYPPNDLKDKLTILLLLSRIAGWLSHISEQSRIGRRIEHISAYIGPPPRLNSP